MARLHLPVEYKLRPRRSIGQNCSANYLLCTHCQLAGKNLQNRSRIHINFGIHLKKKIQQIYCYFHNLFAYCKSKLEGSSRISDNFNHVISVTPSQLGHFKKKSGRLAGSSTLHYYSAEQMFEHLKCLLLITKYKLCVNSLFLVFLKHF